jgi:CheY-like chemotaxis protein
MISTRTIIVVDDSETSRRFARLILERAGYVVVTVQSAFEILSVVRNENPSLVLIDVTMPGLQGDKAVEILLRHRSLQPSMPRGRFPEPVSAPYRVVLYSSKDERELQRLALHCGADGYIKKSPDVDRFIELVQSFAGPPRRA